MEADVSEKTYEEFVVNLCLAESLLLNFIIFVNFCLTFVDICGFLIKDEYRAG